MTITKKNHYNPCFWTAFWNFEYLTEKRLNPLLNQNLRETKVHVLNLKSNKILYSKTEKIFFQKKAGIAAVKAEYLKKILNKLPEKKEVNNQEIEDSIIDFENHFTMLENQYRKSLEKIILTNERIEMEDRVDISTFIAFQLFRNPFILDNLTESFKNNEMEKFEMFLTFKKIISNSESLVKFIGTYLFSEWKIYKLSKNIFALSDNPIMIRKFNLMVALAPNILLEINLNKINKSADKYIIKNKISCFKYHDFITRTITNSSKEIIFGDEEKLKKIQNTNKYKKHILNIKNVC